MTEPLSKAPDAPALRVGIVDDDEFVAASLATILGAEPDIAVAGTAHDGEAACELFFRERPDVLLMDIRMPGMDGLTAAERILAEVPEARIVFLTTFADDGYIAQSLALGARGYLVKQDVSTIAPALRAVMAGQSVLGGEVLGRMEALVRGGAPTGAQPPGAAFDGALSAREEDVARLVAQGLDNREIAEALYLSEGTVRNHISVILQKLGLRNRTQLAVRYYRGK